MIPRCLDLITADMVVDTIRSYVLERSRVGIVIGTYSAVPYIHLQLESRKRFAPDTECLVVDDGSEQRDQLAALCNEYGADFICRPQRIGHVPGDMQTFVDGHEWALRKGVKLLVKFSRRWLPVAPWVKDTERLWMESSAPTLNAICNFHGFGFRSECVAMDVGAWHAADATKVLRDHVAACAHHPPDLSCTASGVLVEHIVHVAAAAARGSWGDGTTNYAVWPWMGTDRRSASPTRYWHEANDTKDYVSLARSWGITRYGFNDFVQPAGNIHLRGPAEITAKPKPCGGCGKGATPLQSLGNAVKAAGRVVAAVVSGDEVTVTEDVRQARLAACRTCEHLRHARVDYCNLCTCWLRAKRLLATEQCPAGKW